MKATSFGCFYHRQDMEYALKYHKLRLASDDIDGDEGRGVEVGERRRSALKATGLRVAWTGSIKDKLELLVDRPLPACPAGEAVWVAKRG